MNDYSDLFDSIRNFEIVWGCVGKYKMNVICNHIFRHQ